MSEKHNHYFRDCPYDKIDVYRIIDIFEITDPVAQHILKKCIATGKRGHKDEKRDWQDILDSAQRRLGMLGEDANVLAISNTGNPPARYHTSTPPVIDFANLQCGLIIADKPPTSVFSDIPLYNRRAEDKGEK